MSKPIRGTNLKCKHCGYEVGFIGAWGKLVLYHSGVEEGYLPNRFCAMVHTTFGAVNSVAELTDKDREEILQSLGGMGQ